MRNLSDTIARLSALRNAQVSGKPGANVPALPELGDFGANPGMLGARLTVPAGLKPGAPLVVVLHGCTQTAAGYDHGAGWSTLAAQHGFAVLFPEQARTNNPNLCFNWFEPGDIRRGAGEALSIANMVEATVARHGLDRSRVYITGLSAGGAMACVMLAAYPELFAGGAIIAGLPYGTASTIPEAFDRMRGQGGPGGERLAGLVRAASDHDGPWPQLSIWQGSADRTVAPSNADALLQQWRGVHGLAEAPSASESIGPHRRHIWRDGAGREAIEVFTVADMGHGTPLDTSLIGHAAPYMLEAGLSSTLRIAGFWGIAEAVTTTAASKTATETAAKPRASEAVFVPHIATSSPRPAREPASGTGGPSPLPAFAGVRRTIEDALRSAGLMR